MLIKWADRIVESQFFSWLIYFAVYVVIALAIFGLYHWVRLTITWSKFKCLMVSATLFVWLSTPHVFTLESVLFSLWLYTCFVFFWKQL